MKFNNTIKYVIQYSSGEYGAFFYDTREEAQENCDCAKREQGYNWKVIPIRIMALGVVGQNESAVL